ncbi:hypothetical protein JYG34_12725 [Pseudomonas entomophila]|uniref:hypothetical protein n=1 Tax=Pseudomonas entomophila TaxID=312306 RepID=UPI001BD17E73|nr:hypothetical protein [Pseudomonas entomophila]QVM93814.1 hypothetical protein JYG34_12725 [Pseudomonas entomophila]
MSGIVICSKQSIKNWGAAKLKTLTTAIEKDKSLADKEETKYELAFWQGLSELGDRTPLAKIVEITVDITIDSIHHNSGITPLRLGDLK